MKFVGLTDEDRDVLKWFVKEEMGKLLYKRL